MFIELPPSQFTYPQNGHRYSAVPPERVNYVFDKHYPHVTFNPLASSFHKNEILEGLSEEEVNKKIAEYRNDELAHSYAPHLDLNVSANHVSFYSVSPVCKGVHSFYGATITQKVDGLRLSDLMTDKAVSENKRQAIRIAANYEMARRTITLGDTDAHDKNVIVQNPQDDKNFRFTHIDMMRSKLLTEPLLNQEELYLHIYMMQKGSELEGINWGRLTTILDQQIGDLDLVKEDVINPNSSKIMRKRLNAAATMAMDYSICAQGLIYS